MHDVRAQQACLTLLLTVDHRALFMNLLIAVRL